MAALTSNKEVNMKDGELLAHPVLTATHIYKGALVKHTAAGYLAPCAAEANAFFAGVAYEEVNNTGASGAKKCRVWTEGVFELNGTGLAQSDVGSTVYASDDQTVSTTQGSNEQAVGKIVGFISSTKILVKINAVVG